jgi:hypothetical protein
MAVKIMIKEALLFTDLQKKVKQIKIEFADQAWVAKPLVGELLTTTKRFFNPIKYFSK